MITKQATEGWWNFSCTELKNPSAIGTINVVNNLWPFQTHAIRINTEPALSDRYKDLAYHDVECPENYFLQYWRLKNSSMDMVYVEYLCVEYTAVVNSSDAGSVCYTEDTGWNDGTTGWEDDGYNIQYLDRHKVQCQAGFGLVGFKGVQTNSDPTAAPTNPTSMPTSSAPSSSAPTSPSSMPTSSAPSFSAPSSMPTSNAPSSMPTSSAPSILENNETVFTPPSDSTGRRNLLSPEDYPFFFKSGLRLAGNLAIEMNVFFFSFTPPPSIV